jgi:hypothetical protein
MIITHVHTDPPARTHATVSVDACGHSSWQQNDAKEVHTCRRLYITTAALLELRGTRRLGRWPNPLAIIPDTRRPLSERKEITTSFFTVPVKELDPGVGQVLRRLISCPEQIWDDPSMFWMQYLRMWTIFQELDTQECFVCRPYPLCAVVLRLSPFPILVLVAFSVRMVCFLPSSSCRATCMFPSFAISTVFWAGRTWRRCTLICGPLF